ncbi:hypothetical protein [Methylogaea oryzae]|uniref:hypothetical protein n=1 Tax=Methylogaea oryzae TaxID=1295382 RepID=UPI00402BBB73
MTEAASTALQIEEPLEDRLAAQLCEAAAVYLEPKQVDDIYRAYQFGAQYHQANTASAASPISATPSPSPSSWPACAWTTTA